MFRAALSCSAAFIFIALVTLQSEAGTTLKRATLEPDSLDPHKMSLLSELNIHRDIFEGLTKSDREGRIIGGAAESWDVSPDGQTYTFHLRPGLKWSDGHDLTAQDFVAGYRRLFDPQTAAQSAAFLYTIKNSQQINSGEAPVESLGVSAPDARTVVITLEGPNPAFPALINSGYTAPFPRHAFEVHGKEWVRPEHLVGNGPFKLTEWVPHTHIRLHPNPHFRGHAGIALDEVLWLPVSDADTAVKQFRAGEIHIVDRVPTAQVERMRSLYTEALHLYPELATVYIVPNMSFAPLADLRVRQALSLATERAVLADKVMRGMGEATWQFTPPNVSSYTAPQLMENGSQVRDQSLETRLARAAALMAEAGYSQDNPLPLVLKTSESRDARNLAIALRAMWKRVNIAAEVRTGEVKTHYSDLSNGNFELAVATYYGWDDPNEFLSLFTAATNQVSFNYGRYDNPLYDQTLKEALTIADIKRRHDRMAEAEAILLSDLAIVPLYNPQSRTLVSSSVEGYADNALNLHPSEYMSLKPQD